ncbi:MAG TPA: metallophosphoesterase, partial [Symbiobacteriaceae bacterium]|nr:metallophosphoesterase [Symbiobacteriaceae bacterium]
MVLQIVHINDTDSTDPDSWAPAADLIRSLRRDGACDVLLHAGDVVLGASSGPEIVGRLDELGFTAFALGNHDFDNGADLLLEQVGPLSNRALCANVFGFTPFRFVEVRGVKIAIVGVVLGDLVLLQPERNLAGFAVTPPAEALGRLIPELRSQADLIIVVSHCGLDADRQLATDVAGIDLIVGGHSHHLLERPEQVGRTSIVQAGAYGRHVGVITATAAGAGEWRFEGRVAAIVSDHDDTTDYAQE